MKIEDFFNQQNVIELSFFNFENAITAAYFARENLEIVRVNDNFRKFFPVLGNVSNAYFPDVLVQLGVSVEQVGTGVVERREFRDLRFHYRDSGSVGSSGIWRSVGNSGI